MTLRVGLLLAGVLGLCVQLTATAPVDSQLDNTIPTDEDGFEKDASLAFPEEIVDVNQTIEQVEAILDANPLLPRLSKEEIYKLLANITAEDRLKMLGNLSDSKESTTADTNRTDDAKAIMVVLPYQAENINSEDIAELYTKPPIIKFVESDQPVVVTDEDRATSQHHNHKYSEEQGTTESDKTKATASPLNADFWHNQAQKVMDDLKKQNFKSSLKSSVYKENKKETYEEMPFKKMPPAMPAAFHTSDTSVEVTVNGEPERPGVKTSGKFSSQYDAESLVFPPNTNPADEVPMPEHLKDLLASVGLYNDKQPANEYPGDKPVHIPAEVQDVLKSFGLSMDDKSTIKNDNVFNQDAPYAYADFKPLPTGQLNMDNAGIPADIEDVLETFGILPSKNAEPSAQLNTNTPQEIKPFQPVDHILNTDFVDPDMFPAGMTSMLTDMGLTKKKGRKIMHKDTDQKDKDNSASLKDVTLGAGPDPLSLDELETIDDQIGNDIKKRQEPSNATTASTSTETTTKASDAKDSASEESGPALADLESSFGGSPADNDPSEAELPPPRKNGFYYMLDWNSFLEVGDGDRKVNIRFDPKLGDPQRFIAVTVP